MNILYITHCDPRRTDFGSAQRSHLMWKALKRLGNVYTIYNVGQFDPDKVFDEIERIATVSLLSPNPIVKTLQILFDRYCAPAEWPFRSSRYIAAQIPWKNIKFDCVVTRYLRTAAQTSAWKIAPLFVDIDDLPSESFATIRRGRHSKLVGALLQSVVNTWQRFVLRKCRGTWIANGEQTAKVAKITPCIGLQNLALEPNPGYVCNGQQAEQLMTIGLMSYEPNYEGVDWFITTCWPAIHTRFPKMVYKVVGKGLSEELRAKWSKAPGVQVLGPVKDLDAVYAASLAVVTPIRAGAGTCIKVIEAALHGRKVLATPFAVRGMDTDTQEKLGILSTEDPVQMITELARLRTNKDLAAHQNAQAKVAQEYNSFEAFEEKIKYVLH